MNFILRLVLIAACLLQSAAMLSARPQETAAIELPPSNIGETQKADDNAFVIDITSRTASATELAGLKKTPYRSTSVGVVLIDGKEISYGALLVKMREELGPDRPINRKAGTPKLSKRAVLIRCHRKEAFEYVKAILQICSDLKVAVFKIRFEVSGEKPGVIPFELPTDFEPGKRPPFINLTLWQAPHDSTPVPIRERPTIVAIEETRLGQADRETTKTVMHKMLSSFHSMNPKGAVRVNARPGVPFERVIEAIEVIRATEVPQFLFVGKVVARRIQKTTTWTPIRQSLLKGMVPEPRLARSEMIGLGGGKSSGRKSGRLDARRGPGRTEQIGVDKGLQWLSDAQAKKGYWTAKDADIEVTSLVLVAMFGVGETHVAGKHRRTLRKGIRWLRAQQNGGGSFSTDPTQNALATLAITEAYALTSSPLFESPSQRGIARLISEVNQRSKRGLRLDTEAAWAGWTILALKSAQTAEIPASKAALHQLRLAIDTALANETASTTPRPLQVSSLALMARVFDGNNKLDFETLQAEATAAFSASLPSSDAPDPQAWLFATIVAYQAGGELWSQWTETFEAAIVSKQIREGINTGSWDPSGKGESQSRIRETALMTLCLETRYRYGRSLGAR